MIQVAEGHVRTSSPFASMSLAPKIKAGFRLLSIPVDLTKQFQPSDPSAGEHMGWDFQFGAAPTAKDSCLSCKSIFEAKMGLTAFYFFMKVRNYIIVLSLS